MGHDDKNKENDDNNNNKQQRIFIVFYPYNILIIYLYSNKLHSIDIFINNTLKYLYCLKL